MTGDLLKKTLLQWAVQGKLVPFGQDVKKTAIGAEVKTLSPKTKIAKKDYAPIGRYPVVDQGQAFIGGYSEDCRIFPKGEYVLFGDHTCVVKYVSFEFLQGADGLKVLVPMSDTLYCKYLYYVMLWARAKLKPGYARHWSKMREQSFCIPSVDTQKRIVAKLEALEPLVARFGEVSAQLKALDAGFKGVFKKSVLQWAVQGKLVPQDPADEPVESLLKRIEEEKKRLVKDGKIKKEKPLPPIAKEEIPFDLPKGWEWVRIESLGSIVGGGTPKTSDADSWKDGTIPWLTPADMRHVKGKFVVRGERNITQHGLDASSARLMPKGSLIYSSRAPIGYVAIAENPLCTNQGFKSLVPIRPEMCNYLYYALIAFTPAIQARASGTTFKEISGSEFAKTVLPLPPLAEQGRIVAKLDEVLGELA